MQATDWQERVAALEARDAARREQLRCIAHDLASPLTPIRLQLSLWKDQGLDQEGLERLERSVERMRRLVEDVADLANIDCHGLRVHMQPTDLGSVVEEAVEAFASQADARGIALHVKTHGQPMASVDRARILQVLDNLLRNALKFTTPGGTVAVDAQQEGQAVRISVSDSGRGLSRQDLGRLFKPYSQVEVEDARMGTGLGLFICQRIAEAHSGHMLAESQGRGQGSHFALLLPSLASVDGGPADADLTQDGGDQGVGRFRPVSYLQQDPRGNTRRRKLGGTRRYAPGSPRRAVRQKLPAMSLPQHDEDRDT